MAILEQTQDLFTFLSSDFPVVWAILTAIMIGFVPVLIWLIFWLSEDRHPEPKRLIARAFLGGGAALVIALPIEAFVASLRTGVLAGFEIFFFAFIEETVKYIVAFVVILRSRELDEGIDALIYMISIALGFAAFENVLYILSPILSDTLLIEAAATSNLRFLGATLLHVVASASIGLSLAFTYYSRRAIRTFSVSIGLAIAVVLHTLFNLLIMHLPEDALYTVFLAVWFLIVGLLIATERIKQIDREHTITPNNYH